MSYDLLFVAKEYAGTQPEHSEASSPDVIERRGHVIAAIQKLSPGHRLVNTPPDGEPNTGWFGDEDGGSWPDFDVYPRYFFAAFHPPGSNDPNGRKAFLAFVAEMRTLFAEHGFVFFDPQDPDSYLTTKTDKRAAKPWWKFW